MGLHKKGLKNPPLIGAHVSIAGGISKAPDRGAAHGCTAIQVFTKSPNQWRAAPLENEEYAAFKERWKATGMRAVVAHDAYLINLASPDAALWKRSLKAFIEEMNRCALLGIPALVMHPGSHGGQGEPVGLRRVAQALGRCLEIPAADHVRILLETTAGQGNCLGATFEHLAEIISLTKDDPRLGICFDTCHVFAAGYDIRTPAAFEKVIRNFDEIIGLDRLSLFHLNDSKGELGSHLDRHQHIGEGRIGPELFRTLVRDRKFKKVPKIIETPGGVEGGTADRTNLARLFDFAR
ncbi:MAG: deoxyribonuclease IV [Planctomycetes bacterium]|nr:deoxyribonuclease IV [Planctomycetota bacterium]